MTPGRFFFICIGTVKTSSAPAARSAVDAVADDLRRGVVEIGLEHRDRVAFRAVARVPAKFGIGRLADHDAEDVGSMFAVAEPAPWPTEYTVMSGIGPNDSAIVVRTAAPVGVVSSPVSMPESIGRAAQQQCRSPGRESESTPCAQVTVPDPTAMGEHSTWVTPSISRARTAPTTSMMASTAPTSWKWTFSIVVPWTAASALARRSEDGRGLFLYRGREFPPSIMAITCFRCR